MKINALTAAAEAACMILSVDETVRNPNSQKVCCIVLPLLSHLLSDVDCGAQAAGRSHVTWFMGRKRIKAERLFWPIRAAPAKLLKFLKRLEIISHRKLFGESQACVADGSIRLPLIRQFLLL